MAWDATIVHTCAASHLSSSAVSQRAAAGAAETLKARKYADLADRFDFRPVGVESLGAFGPQALELVQSIVARFRGHGDQNGVRARIYPASRRRRAGRATHAGS